MGDPTIGPADDPQPERRRGEQLDRLAHSVEDLGRDVRAGTAANDIEALTVAVDALAGEVRLVRVDMESDRKRYRRRLLMVSVVVLAALVGIGALLVRDRDIRRISDQRAHDLAEQRIAACRQYNDQQKRARDASVQIATTAVIAGLTQLAADPAHLSPEEQAIRDRVVVQVTDASTQTALAAYPYRDCSAAGIDRYLSHPPPDPNRKR
jgi:hypothetical protein